MSASSPPCPTCGKPLSWIQQYNQWYCYAEQKYHAPATSPAAQAQPAGGLWFQNFYRIRKKVIALAQQYYIEDQAGRPLGYSRQKMFQLKEDIRVFTDDTMSRELFDPYGRLFGQIKQETGRALMRRFMPMGGLVPDKLTVELNGQTVAVIDQQFKGIGDAWEINAQWTPPALDRRVLLAAAILMGMIERRQGG